MTPTLIGALATASHHLNAGLRAARWPRLRPGARVHHAGATAVINRHCLLDDHRQPARRVKFAGCRVTNPEGFHTRRPHAGYSIKGFPKMSTEKDSGHRLRIWRLPKRAPRPRLPLPGAWSCLRRRSRKRRGGQAAVATVEIDEAVYIATLACTALPKTSVIGGEKRRRSTEPEITAERRVAPGLYVLRPHQSTN